MSKPKQGRLPIPQFLAAVTLVVLGACSDSDKATPAPAPSPDSPAASSGGGSTAVPTGSLTVANADPVHGEQLFNANCSVCHQIGGGGSIGLAPAIRNRDFLALASDDFIRATVAGGRAGTAMIPRPDLTGDQVTEIIAYLRDLEVPNPVSITVDDSRVAAGSVADGGANFEVFCSYCHGPKGQGYAAGGVGPAIGMPGFLTVASDDYISKTVKHGRVGTAMRPFDGAKGLANLNDQEIDDIIVWLRSDK